MTDPERIIKGLEQFKADFKPFCGNGADWARVDDAINLLKEQEAVVRCKDCKHWDAKKNECNNINSYMQYRPCFGDWFCADGERKD